jgi:uncharacterized protein (TIGR02145 family)
MKIYFSDDISKKYNIVDITDMCFIHSNLSYSMTIFQKDNSKISYDIRLISSISFVDYQKLQIKYGFEPTTYNISDIDSIIFTFNTCTEIQIGNQIWMCRNLDVDHYRNGDSIPEVRESAQWANLTTGAWCYYNNSDSLGKIYGKLYNWYAVNDPRGLAPEGWHIPSYNEWTELETFLGGSDIAGGKLKSTGTIEDRDGLWYSPNIGAINSSGFSGFPGGANGTGTFRDMGVYANWWSSIERDEESVWGKYLEVYTPRFTMSRVIKKAGISVRCIKDN